MDKVSQFVGASGYKYNPVEHRLLSQITPRWNDAPLLSVKDTADRTVETTTT
ncbi:MAG: hypothetical protein MJY69_01025 [Bacteroidales bacterium]|nr:hypothetical protein [Bacteroidales bacterium]